jgi:hypothetical protein
MHMVGWMTCYHKKIIRFFFLKGGKRRKRSDSTCDQYTNACKLGANWNH